MGNKEITLEEANAVVLAHREADYKAKDEEAKAYLGRYFKTRNSYGGQNAEKWWLYGATTETNGLGGCYGVTFQRTAMDHVEIRLRDIMWVVQRSDAMGWKEITATEFHRAAHKVLGEVTQRIEALSFFSSHPPMVIPVHVLDDGRRVVSAEHMEKVFDWLADQLGDISPATTPPTGEKEP